MSNFVEDKNVIRLFIEIKKIFNTLQNILLKLHFFYFSLIFFILFNANFFHRKRKWYSNGVLLKQHFYWYLSVELLFES